MIIFLILNHTLKNFTSLAIAWYMWIYNNYSKCFTIHCTGLLFSHRSSCIAFLDLVKVRCNLRVVIVENSIVEPSEQLGNCELFNSQMLQSDVHVKLIQYRTWVPSDFPTCTLALSILLTPGPRMAYVHSLFKSSKDCTLFDVFC